MKSKLKVCLPLALATIVMVGCKEDKKAPETKENKETKLVVTNDVDLALTSKPVIIKRDAFKLTGKEGKFPIVVFQSDTIPAQVNDLNGDGIWDELFMVTDFAPKESKALRLSWTDVDPKFEVKTSARFGKRNGKKLAVQPKTEEVLMANEVHKALGYQPYQTDGPTWENDKVGFRHYLDGRNAKDVFGKKTPGITPEDVGIDSLGGVRDNYHVMNDWGRDIFPVGNSAGLGGYSLLIKDKIPRLGITRNDTVNNVEKTTFKIVSEGPVNSVLSYDYHNWKAEGNTYQVNEITSIWPGVYAFENTVKLEGITGDEIFLAAISNINNDKPLLEVNAGNYVCLIQHGGLTYEKEWVLGTAIIVPKDIYKGITEAPKKGQLTDSYFAKLEVENDKPISYYAVAGWELSADSNFKDPEYFSKYVTNLAEQLSAKISVEVE